VARPHQRSDRVVWRQLERIQRIRGNAHPHPASATHVCRASSAAKSLKTVRIGKNTKNSWGLREEANLGPEKLHISAEKLDKNECQLGMVTDSEGLGLSAKRLKCHCSHRGAFNIFIWGLRLTYEYSWLNKTDTQSTGII